MGRNEGACLICGEALEYFREAQEMECSICHKKYTGYASCRHGHYVCDRCHEEKGLGAIMEQCEKSTLKNPVSIMQAVMENPYIYMHGPEHHVLVGAALLTAYRNSGGQINLDAALREMESRGSGYPGGACGLWGCCGAAASAGMFVSIVTEATPLSSKPWALSNQMTARALDAIAGLGGPRCCKRNSFTAAKEAVLFTRENLGIAMELPEKIQCGFSNENRQCLGKNCPYHGPGTDRRETDLKQTGFAR